MLDLRLPAGLFFGAVGMILLLMGIFNPSDRAALTPTNVNLIVGVFMIVFGTFLLILSRRAKT
jgi:uncharacterized membrane protein HdeD (DUF308 family)